MEADHVSELKDQPYLAAAKSAPEQNTALQAPQVVLAQSPRKFMAETETLSSCASHDRMETASNLTHVEIESVVSSWLDDDDCFMQSAMHDIRITQLQQQRAVPAPATVVLPPGKGWKVASSNSNQRVSSQRKQQRSRGGAHFNGGIVASNVNPGSANVVSSPATNCAPNASVSGGRFDALVSDVKRRR